MSLTQVQAAIAENRRILYRREPLEYLVERLGIARETVDWNLIPAYKAHKWDATPNPLKTIIDEYALGHWLAVESATGTGKTFLGACLLLHFLECYDDSIVLTIAPKHDQLALHIWKEVHRIYPAFGLGQLAATELKMKPPSTQHIAIAFVAGVRKDEVETSATRAQGFHAEHMLIICEETPGIAEAVMAAFQNTAAGKHNVIIAFGNPNNQHDTLHRFAQLAHVKPIRMSAFDHPNVVTGNDAFVAGAQTRYGLQRMLNKYGSKDHPMYLSRAHGISPAQAQDSLIKWDWCVAAAQRSIAKAGPKALGVDVANSETGDLAAIAHGEGSRLTQIESFPCPNANKLGEQVHQIIVYSKIAARHVGVDGVGVGAGTVNELLRLGDHVTNIQSGAKMIADVQLRSARMAEVFDNFRSQLWWQMRLDLQFGDESQLILPYDEELFADLCSIRWTQQGSKIKVERKEDIKKRLGRSPNKGDACVYWNWTRQDRVAPAAHAEAEDAELVEHQTFDNFRDDYLKADRIRSW